MKGGHCLFTMGFRMKPRTTSVMRIGREWRGRCPTHQATRFSVAVAPKRGPGTCHNQRGQSGSILDLEMAISGFDTEEVSDGRGQAILHRGHRRRSNLRRRWRGPLQREAPSSLDDAEIWEARQVSSFPQRRNQPNSHRTPWQRRSANWVGPSSKCLEDGR